MCPFSCFSHSNEICATLVLTSLVTIALWSLSIMSLVESLAMISPYTACAHEKYQGLRTGERLRGDGPTYQITIIIITSCHAVANNFA